MNSPRSTAEFFKLLSSPDQIIGQPESLWLDFKGDVYLPQDTKPHHRWELAKDVTSMANSGGGVIVLGVATSIDPASRVELASELRPVPHGLVDPSAIQKVIHDWVFPRLDVIVASHAIADKEGELWTIEVPRQSERDTPFIISGALNAEDRRQHTAFGIFKRTGTDNAPVLPSQAQQWIRHGFSALTHTQREALPPQPEDAEGVLRDDLTALGQDEPRAHFYIQIAPTSPLRLDRFFSGEEPSLWNAMYRLEQTKEGGFNLPSGTLPQRGWKNSHRTAIAGKSTLSVMLTGLTTVTTSQAMLTWASKSYAVSGETLINPHVFPELSLEACTFFAKHVASRLPLETEFQWRIGLFGVEKPVAMRLPRGPFQTLMFRDRPGSQPQPGKDFVLPWQVVPIIDPEALSFQMCLQVYDVFHIGADGILFSEKGRINPGRIRDQKY